MLIGVIKTRDLILHPVSVFSIQGARGFFRILRKALSRDKYRFLDILQMPEPVVIGRPGR